MSGSNSFGGPGEASGTSDPNDPEEAAGEFLRRLTDGEYRNLFGEALSEVIQQAAAEPGLSDEIGILRVVLARILVEERDPARLATSVSRLAGVAVQAARAQQEFGGDRGGELSEALFSMLAGEFRGTDTEVST